MTLLEWLVFSDWWSLKSLSLTITTESEWKQIVFLVGAFIAIDRVSGEDIFISQQKTTLLNEINSNGKK